MSVYIKGMEMPKSCAFCRIKRRNGKKMVCPLCDEEWDIHDSMSADHKLENCPLVPVPKHGRLIDADAMMKQGVTQFDWNDVVDVEDIKAAPTIIPAEEGE